MTKSIYFDTFYTVSAGNSPFSYSIDLDGRTIFNGKAWNAPEENTIKIGINKIAQDYLSIDFPTLSSGTSITSHPNAFRTFTLKNESGSTLETYNFLLDWSGKERNFGSSIILSDPINGKGVSGMYYFNTVWSNGVSTTASKTASMAGYTEIENCGSEWALYYLNRGGGFDSFLIEGLVRKKDSYDRLNITRNFNNNTLDFGKKTYNNQITTEYEVVTGWLSDEESNNLAFNLLSSNQVLIHNVITGEIEPVVITDASGDYKTYKNNGRKMINYTINLSSSQTKQNIS